jgi:hypothetical protein
MMNKSSTSLSAEQQLAAIIEAQVKGGYKEYTPTLQFLMEGLKCLGTGKIAPKGFHILEILLDPAGLKAAYGDWPEWKEGDELRMCSKTKSVATAILNTWLSTSDPKATIETAYSLLPKA